MGKDYTAHDWLAILKANNLDGFDKLWDVKAPWLEPVNQCRAGWSGICRLNLKHPDGHDVSLYLKRQHNHTYLSAQHGLKKMPTFDREFSAMQLMQAQHVEGLKPVFYGLRRDKDGVKAILATEALEETMSLRDFFDRWGETTLLTVHRDALIKLIAKTIKSFHQTGLVHNCLYHKHLLIKNDIAEKLLNQETNFDYQSQDWASLALIDLEKSHRTFRQQTRLLRDLYTFNCAIAKRYRFSNTIRLRFLKAYLGISKLNKEAKKTWRKIDQSTKKRDRDRYFVYDPQKPTLRSCVKRT